MLGCEFEFLLSVCSSMLFVNDTPAIRYMITTCSSDITCCASFFLLETTRAYRLLFSWYIPVTAQAYQAGMSLRDAKHRVALASCGESEVERRSFDQLRQPHKYK